MTAYPFKTKPFTHQLTCWLRQKDDPYFAYLAEMGTGKSKMLIDTAAWLYDQSKIDSLVVIAPKGVYRNWADSEIPAHMPDHIRYRVGVWSAEARKADRDALASITKVTPDLRILLMNVEALGRDLDNNKAFTFLSSYLSAYRCMLAVDESTTIKNPQATRTKALLRIRGRAPYRRILSGQPAVNGPLDMFSQCAFLSPSVLGYDNFFAFKTRYAQLVKMRAGDRSFQKVVGYRHLDELNRNLSRYAFIVKKEDCLDLPAKLPPSSRVVDLGSKQARAYEQMRNMAVAELEQRDDIGDPANTSTAQLVITQMLRLHQILNGFLVTDDKTAVPFDEPNPRLELLVQTLEEVSGKVLIWATYKLTVRQIAERLAKEYGPEAVGTYYGETSVEDRRRNVAAFQDPSNPLKYLILNKTGARGLTLTAAHTAIYYSYDPDLDAHDQSQDRIHRIGQHWPCTYIYFLAPGTVEERFLTSLKTKQDLSRQITPSNWRLFLGA